MRKNEFVLFFIITELYLLLNIPYAVNRVWPIINIYVSSALYVGALLLFLSTSHGIVKTLPHKFNVAFFTTIGTWLAYSIIHSDSSYLTRVLLLVITYLFLLIINNKGDFVKFWKYNNYYIFLQVCFSLIIFVLVAIGLMKPLIIAHVSNEISDKIVYFWGLSFSKTYIGNLIRPSGFLDEPGALAAWAIYSLMFNYAFINDKLIKKYLPWFTTVTLSVAYFIQIGAFLVLSNVKKIHKLVFVAIIVFVGITLINLTKGSSFDVYEKTIARFEYSDETIIEGNNRAYATEAAKQYFLSSPVIGVGGRTMGAVDEKVADNPYEILAKDGIIGFIVSYLPLILILFYNRRKEVIVAVIVVAVGYLQRPLHINFMHDMYIWSFLLFALKDLNNSRPNRLRIKY